MLNEMEMRMREEFWSKGGFGVAYAPSAPLAGSSKQPPFSVLSKKASCFEPRKPHPPENRVDLCINKNLTYVLIFAVFFGLAPLVLSLGVPGEIVKCCF